MHACTQTQTRIPDSHQSCPTPSPLTLMHDGLTDLCGQHRRNQERPRRLARRKPRHTLAQPAAPGCSMPAYNPRIIRASCNVKAMTEYGYCVYSHVHAHAYAGGRDSCRFAPLRLHRGPASIEAPGEIDVGVQRRFHMQHTPPNMFMNSCNQMSLSCVCARERDRRIDRETDKDRESETDREVMNTQARARTHTLERAFAKLFNA